jgi:class 3 adenylate cyclase/tetratricopeptide (TPR) repeat protein
VNASARFCRKCGTSLSTNSIGSKAIATRPSSGAEIRLLAEQAGADVADGERKTVTALFADIKGSTELMRELDPEEARAIIDPVLQLMMNAVHRYDGYVAQSTGDGIFAMFGAPVAHEDHPQRALHAALAIQQELHDYRERLKDHSQPHLEARIGVNTGEVVLRTVNTGGHTEYSPVGHVANLAARMQTVASAGSIVITEECRRLVEGYFSLRALGPTEIKGISEPVNVYEVIGPGALRGHFELAAQRGLTKFVGRERELAELRRAIELAIGGHGQIVAVVADAGTGKSRLFHELKAAIPNGCKLLEAYSVSHGKASAWLPVLELLRGYFGIADSNDAASRREQVAAALTALDPALEDALPYLLSLLAIVEGADPLAQMDPKIKRQRTLDGIKRLILRESLQQPMVIIFEDLHWIDEQTQALLDLLSDTIASSRLLLLFNYRPEYRHEWTNKSYYSQLRLDPLAAAEETAMLSALLGDDAAIEPVGRLIAERAGGNPFFIEEIVQALFDDGTLVRNGAVRVTRPLAELRLPATVQGILASRIDRLPAAQKDLLQTLAVIGRESAMRLLAQVAGIAETQLVEGLAILRAGEFVYEQPASTDVEYVFKHALTQEVAYNSLLIARRKQLHERVGYSMETLFADNLDDHVDALAHHYSHSENADKAIEYLARAGQRALQRSAHDQAIRNLNSAIERLKTLPDSSDRKRRELSFQVMLGPALIALTGWGTTEVELTSARALELCAALGDPPELFGVMYASWSLRFIRADMRAAHAAALLLVVRGEELHDRAMLRMAHGAMGMTLFHMGEAKRAGAHFRSGLALDDPAQRLTPMGIDVRVVHLCYQAWALWYLGYPDQALKSDLDAVARAQALSHPHTTAFANGHTGTLRVLLGEFDEVLEVADSQHVFCSRYGLADFLARAVGLRGTVTASRGQEEGIPLIEEWVASGRKTGLKMVRPLELCWLAEAGIALNQLDKASGALAEALTIAESDGDRYCEAETHRLRGELLMKCQSNATKAQACFERAIEVARKQEARCWELRATASLARLLRNSNRRDEARTMLAEIYNWFTEGFDTADLKEAKALLDELTA